MCATIEGSFKARDVVFGRMCATFPPDGWAGGGVRGVQVSRETGMTVIHGGRGATFWMGWRTEGVEQDSRAEWVCSDARQYMNS